MAGETSIPNHPNLKDLTGQTFHRLIVIGRFGSDKWGKPLWNCKCQCGKTLVILAASLRSGNTKSCGCMKLEMHTKRLTTHGGKSSDIYETWKNVTQRCCNPKNASYPNYGGRGITMCDRWRHSFENFRADMGHRPAGCTLERVNNSLGYSPENCIWASQKDQSRNKRNNLVIECRGEEMCLAKWCDTLGIKYRLAADRIRLGWSVEEVLFGRYAKCHKINFVRR